MDTLSRDSNSSSNVLPLVGVIAGALGLILAITALVKQNSIKKEIEVLNTDVTAKISTLEGDVRNAAAENTKSNNALREGVQNALNQVAEQMGVMRGQIAKLEEAQKARAAAPAPTAKGGAAPAPTGVLNADGTYTIASGDTISKIARKFAVKPDAIEAENPGLDPARLKVGQKIRIPKK
jgi:LysM repeat protein